MLALPGNYFRRPLPRSRFAKPFFGQAGSSVPESAAAPADALTDDAGAFITDAAGDYVIAA